MARFLPLTVTGLRRETRDAVVLTLAPRDEDRRLFAFTQGQHLTFRRNFGGHELRRSYSICSGRDDGCLRVAIKRVPGGAFSTWANESLAPGTQIEAMPPTGRFHAPLDPAARRHYLAVAAGSGITPILSIIRTVLAAEPLARVTLIYANRQVASIMFREELEDLKNLYLERLSILHVLKSDAQEIELLTGRLDAGRMAALLRHWIRPADLDLAFVCGPEGLTRTVTQTLREHGLRDDQIRFELFGTAQPGQAPRAPAPLPAMPGDHAPAVGEVTLTVTLDGTTRSMTMPARGESLLDAALARRIDAPWSCRAGVCSTCRCKVLEGEVEMAVNHALEDDEVRAGYVLSCQAYPRSPTVAISYDD